ncbi:MAG: GIY-YIG nuclease family protein [Gammaproteobacteria bacterium]|jgi:putative endonuclease
MNWCVYILKCGDASLYTGITNNIQARLQAHENGTGAKYTKGRAPFTLIYIENCVNRSAASKREAQIKKLSHKDKLDLNSVVRS